VQQSLSPLSYSRSSPSGLSTMTTGCDIELQKLREQLHQAEERTRDEQKNAPETSRRTTFEQNDRSRKSRHAMRILNFGTF